MRLAKYLAHAGVASRRAAETLIAAGRVSVAGEVVDDPALDVDATSRVAVDGTPVGGPEPRVTYAVNKPIGVVSTARDTHGRATVVALVPAGPLRLYPVGRLDADSSGLMLVTNDGELANLLTHPRFEVPKTYRVRLGGDPIAEDALEALRAGVELDDGPTAPAEVARERARRRDHDPRRPQPPGAPDVRGGRPSRDRAAAHALRADRARRVGHGSASSPARGRAVADARAGAPGPRRRGCRRRGCALTQSPPMRLFALRGAVSVHRNKVEDVLDATTELMREIMARNQLSTDNVVSCIFTATRDLNAEFPAVAARALGFDRVPLLCAQEIPVPHSMPRVVRVLIHYYADDDHVPAHVYLGDASALRTDLQAAQ
jgi:23S rRNA pseudouridine2605 synthase